MNKILGTTSSNYKQGRLLYYFLLFIFGVINGFISQYVFAFLAFWATGGYVLLGVGGVINLFGITSIPGFYPLFIVVDVLIASSISVFILRHIKPTEKKFSRDFIIAVILFVILEFAILILPALYQQVRTERENPTQTGEASYDFSKDILFNDRRSAKGKLIVEENKVVWLENTKEFPVYPENIWDIFTFDFSPETSKGVTTQITHFDKATSKPDNVYLLDGKIYLLQRNGDFYVYNAVSQKPELLMKHVPGKFSGQIEERISVIYGKVGNLIVFEQISGVYDPIGGVYIYDILRKEKTELPFTEVAEKVSKHLDPFKIVAKDPYICYVSEDNRIGRYDVLSKQNIMIATDAQFSSPRILDCQGQYIAYLYQEFPVEEIYVVDAEKGVSVVKKHYDIPTFYPKGVKGLWRGELHGEKFYYSFVSDTVIELNLTDSTERTILSESGIQDWRINGEYIVYAEYNEEEAGKKGRYDSTLHLKKINK